MERRALGEIDYWERSGLIFRVPGFIIAHAASCTTRHCVAADANPSSLIIG